MEELALVVELHHPGAQRQRVFGETLVWVARDLSAFPACLYEKKTQEGQCDPFCDIGCGPTKVCHGFPLKVAGILSRQRPRFWAKTSGEGSLAVGRGSQLSPVVFAFAGAREVSRQRGPTTDGRGWAENAKRVPSAHLLSPCLQSRLDVFSGTPPAPTRS